MAQNVSLQGCDLEMSRSSMKVKNFSIRPSTFTHKYTCEASLKSYCHFFFFFDGVAIVDQKMDGGIRRRSKKKLFDRS